MNFIYSTAKNLNVFLRRLRLQFLDRMLFLNPCPEVGNPPVISICPVLIREIIRSQRDLKRPFQVRFQLTSMAFTYQITKIYIIQYNPAQIDRIQRILLLMKN